MILDAVRYILEFRFDPDASRVARKLRWYTLNCGVSVFEGMKKMGNGKYSKSIREIGTVTARCSMSFFGSHGSCTFVWSYQVLFSLNFRLLGITERQIFVES